MKHAALNEIDDYDYCRRKSLHCRSFRQLHCLIVSTGRRIIIELFFVKPEVLRGIYFALAHFIYAYILSDTMNDSFAIIIHITRRCRYFRPHSKATLAINTESRLHAAVRQDFDSFTNFKSTTIICWPCLLRLLIFSYIVLNLISSFRSAYVR